MLVQWGFDQAQREGLPAFMEASPAGQPVYERVGFQRVGEQTLDLKEHGIPTPMVVGHMATQVD